MEALVKLALRVYRVLAEALLDAVRRLAQLLGLGGLPGNRATAHGLLHRLGQTVLDEAFDLAALVVYDPVDPEIQLLALELEELAQQVLQPRKGVTHTILRYPTASTCISPHTTQVSGKLSQ